MCVSVSPNVEVRFQNTILYAGEARREDGKIVHVLGYQNVVQNDVGKRGDSPFWTFSKNLFGFRVGNAMLLPFPAVPRTMTEANILDTSGSPRILKDISDSLGLGSRVIASRSMLQGLSFAVPEIQVFEAAGIYTIVLAQDARAIPDALNKVPKERRPELNEQLFAAYAKWYPNWTFALCCFNNPKLREALPLLWWYEPVMSDRLFLPTLDCHTGDVPDLNANVMLDHSIAVSSYRLDEDDKNNLEELLFHPGFYPGQVQYSEKMPPHLTPYLPKRVLGKDFFGGGMTNGDFFCHLEDIVAKRQFNPRRSRPPFEIQPNRAV